MDAIFVLFALVVLIAAIFAIALKAWRLNERPDDYDPRGYLRQDKPRSDP